MESTLVAANFHISYPAQKCDEIVGGSTMYLNKLAFAPLVTVRPVSLQHNLLLFSFLESLHIKIH